MKVRELKAALEGIPDEAVISVGVTYTWDGKSGDALMSHEIDIDWDGPDGMKQNALSFLICGDVSYDEILKAAE